MRYFLRFLYFSIAIIHWCIYAITKFIYLYSLFLSILKKRIYLRFCPRQRFTLQRFFTRPTTCSLLNSTGWNFALGRVASRLTKSLAIYYGWHSDETLYVSPWLFYFRHASARENELPFIPAYPGDPGTVWELTRSRYALCSHRPRTRRVSIKNSRDSAPARGKKMKDRGLRACDYSNANPPVPRASFTKSIRRNLTTMNVKCIKIFYGVFVTFVSSDWGV